jgi:DNA anti-recombination protein RmuC
VGILGECLTFAPLFYERLTKKKLPAMGGTLGEMQQALTQLATSYQQLHLGIQTIVNNQTKIFNRINSLESNASRRLLNLDQRMANLSGVKLTYEKERQQIECGNNSISSGEQY